MSLINVEMQARLNEVNIVNQEILLDNHIIMVFIYYIE